MTGELHPLTRFGVTHTDRVRVSPIEGCAWKCHFCDLPYEFAYRKKEGRREYVRVSLEPGPDGVQVARKHPQDGAGVLTSLTRTDGLVELAEDMTRIEEGTIVPFLAYALLIG